MIFSFSLAMVFEICYHLQSYLKNIDEVIYLSSLSLVGFTYELFPDQTAAIFHKFNVWDHFDFYYPYFTIN